MIRCELMMALAILSAASVWCQKPAVPHTPDGHPDLQGVWTNASVLPLERPAILHGKEFYTPEEAAENAKRVLGISSWDRLGNQAREHYNMSQYGLDLSQSKVAMSLRTSLIIGPDGRIPRFTPEAQKRLADRAARNRGHQFDGPENRPLQERCILYASEGPPTTPWTFNSNLQIVQDAGHVAVLQEMIHSTRIIPTDDSPHLPSRIRQWMGDSRGHWEGETLVVDTTNFSDKTSFHGSTASLHLVERFTRIDADNIMYEFTVDDPATWVRPWTAQVPMTRIDSPIFEFACHEGNLGIFDTLSGARAAEKKAAEETAQQAAKKGSQ